jgi:hypothetical protein
MSFVRPIACGISVFPPSSGGGDGKSDRPNKKRLLSRHGADTTLQNHNTSKAHPISKKSSTQPKNAELNEFEVLGSANATLHSNLWWVKVGCGWG